MSLNGTEIKTHWKRIKSGKNMKTVGIKTKYKAFISSYWAFHLKNICVISIFKSHCQ